MTSPANGLPGRASAPRPNGSAFGATATPPDHRTTALQSAVAMLRGRNLANTEDVLSMAEAFLNFLKAGDRR